LKGVEKMSRCVLIKIGYSMFVAPMNEDIGPTINLLESLVKVDQEYVDGEYIYTPEEKAENLGISFINISNVRELSKDEKENKEISSLKQTISWRDSTIEDLKKKLELAECKCKINEAEKTN